MVQVQIDCVMVCIGYPCTMVSYIYKLQGL